MYQIQKLNIYNPERDGAANQTAMTNSTPGPHSHLACQTLDLLLTRLLARPPVAQTWIEKIVVTRIWISSLSLHVQDHPSKLRNLFDDIAHANGTKLGLEATHASQSVSRQQRSLQTKNSNLTIQQLVWKAVTTLQQSQNEEEATQWCTLASHDIFASSGDINKAKLSR